MQRILMMILAAGAVLGGIDRLTGNRFGLGKKSEEAIGLLGSIAASMAGILCLAPLLANVLGKAVVPVYRALGFDPSMFASILALDMGGFEMAKSLADDPAIGSYSGIVVGAIFGCTLSFSIPVGMGMLKGEDAECYSLGMLCGLATMPAALIVGGLVCGLSFGKTLFQLIPVLILSAAMLAGLIRARRFTVRCFGVFAKGIQILTIIGLVLGAVTYMTGWEILPGLMPVEDALAVCGGIAIVMMGSLPVAELLRRALRRPLEWLANRLRVNVTSMTGFLVTPVGMLPTLALMPDMDRRGRIANAAFIVSGTSGVAAHFGFCAAECPELLVPMLISKLTGALLATAMALIIFRENKA